MVFPVSSAFYPLEAVTRGAVDSQADRRLVQPPREQPGTSPRWPGSRVRQTTERAAVASWPDGGQGSGSVPAPSAATLSAVQSPARHYILTVSCPDAVGLVAAVSGLIASWGGWLSEVSNHSDPDTGRFFMRNEILAESLPFGIEEFRQGFLPLALRHRMDFAIRDSHVLKRVMILVSREDHCLVDLLHRWRTGEMRLDLRGVVSNHETTRPYVEHHGVDFHHVPIGPSSRSEDFARLERLLDGEAVDLVVLARYMQILPEALCARYAGKILNIHHSFLPSFVGRKPYQQAYERGVKLIGATSHFVTSELDEGPIIEQDVIRVDHGDTVEDMVRLGRDVEKSVLARALRFVIEDRVLINGNKTVVFS
jgi:formyltetrahydrofolate deformylase